MSPSRYTREQIRKALEELKSGHTIKKVSRKYGMSTTTLYRWRVNLAPKKRLTNQHVRDLEVENRRLKNKFAELTLDYNSLRAALVKESKTEC
jgi:putative transposase